MSDEWTTYRMTAMGYAMRGDSVDRIVKCHRLVHEPVGEDEMLQACNETVAEVHATAQREGLNLDESTVRLSFQRVKEAA